jgi:KaiC/GvpD/RAD55 family RecA-like ATPase
MTEQAKRGIVLEDARPLDLSDNLLVMGPALSGKRTVAFDLLADAYEAEGCPCAITATDTAAQFRTRFAPYVGPDQHVADVVVIDSCAGSSSGESRDGRTLTVGTPADLTGLGVQLSKAFGRLPPGRQAGSRVLVDSLSTLLIYSDIERLFRFVNVMNRRINEAGGETVYLLDTEAVDPQHRQQLLQLFSTVIEVRDAAERPEYRIRGTETTEWQGYAAVNRS